MINPSGFSYKITFQKNIVTVDEIGNHKNVWRDYYTCHTFLSGENGREITQEGLTIADYDLTFTVRYCKKLSDVNSTNFRIVFDSEIYNIDEIDHMNFTNETLKFKCRKVRIKNEQN